MIKRKKRAFFQKPRKVTFDNQRLAKLDKLEKEGGIVRPNKNTKIYSRGRESVKWVIFKNHKGYAVPKKQDLKTFQDLRGFPEIQIGL